MQTPPLRPVSIGFSGQAYVGLEVKGKPFSAQQQWEQTWTQRNTSTRSSARIYRDSAGRTRREWPVFRLSPDPPIVEILDSRFGMPVHGRHSEPHCALRQSDAVSGKRCDRRTYA